MLGKLFGKKKDEDKKTEEKTSSLSNVPGAPNPDEMNFFQRFAYNRFLKMSPEDQRKALQKAMKPENIKKHQGEILESLETMRKQGMISDDQYRLAKLKLGIK